MRISELLDQEVFDPSGRKLGKVHDVRLVQDVPASEGQDAAFRVDGLVVGRAGLATRLGYTRNGIQGPWLVKYLVTRRERRTDEISWAEIDRSDGRLVRR